MFWRKNFQKRYKVSWDAVLEVRFSDSREEMPIKVVDFSESGARIHSQQVYHLVVAKKKPSLTLKYQSAHGLFESRVEIRWYTWLTRENMFEIGVLFTDLPRERRPVLQTLLHHLKNGYGQEASSAPAGLIPRTLMWLA